MDSDDDRFQFDGDSDSDLPDMEEAESPTKKHKGEEEKKVLVVSKEVWFEPQNMATTTIVVTLTDLDCKPVSLVEVHCIPQCLISSSSYFRGLLTTTEAMNERHELPIGFNFWDCRSMGMDTAVATAEHVEKFFGLFHGTGRFQNMPEWGIMWRWTLLQMAFYVDAPDLIEAANNLMLENWQRVAVCSGMNGWKCLAVGKHYKCQKLIDYATAYIQRHILCPTISSRTSLLVYKEFPIELLETIGGYDFILAQLRNTNNPDNTKRCLNPLPEKATTHFVSSMPQCRCVKH